MRTPEPEPATIRLLAAGHPLPDARGRGGDGGDPGDAPGGGGPDDLVLALISGGGSALLADPVPPITLGELQAVTDALLRAGATIGELNTVRKHLARLKGGGLAAAAAPAPVVALILSDVVGSPLDVIALGPDRARPFARLLRHGRFSRVMGCWTGCRGRCGRGWTRGGRGRSRRRRSRATRCLTR